MLLTINQTKRCALCSALVLFVVFSFLGVGYGLEHCTCPSWSCFADAAESCSPAPGEQRWNGSAPCRAPRCCFLNSSRPVFLTETQAGTFNPSNVHPDADLEFVLPDFSDGFNRLAAGSLAPQPSRPVYLLNIALLF